LLSAQRSAPGVAGRAAPTDRGGIAGRPVQRVIALVNGQAFLTGLWGYIRLPGLGRVEIGTPALFDLGVYLVVMGVTLAFIFNLEEAE
jgi:hypothetical protein